MGLQCWLNGGIYRNVVSCDRMVVTGNWKQGHWYCNVVSCDRMVVTGSWRRGHWYLLMEASVVLMSSTVSESRTRRAYTRPWSNRPSLLPRSRLEYHIEDL
jgi:hypothetical protein